MKTREWLAAFALCCYSAVGAEELQQKKLYRWVDEQGQVHFSDRAPAGHPAEVTQTELPATGSSEQAPTENPYSVENQVKQFEEDRKAREAAQAQAQQAKKEAELRKAKIEAAKAEKAAAEREIVQGGGYWPILPPPPPPNHRPPPQLPPSKPRPPLDHRPPIPVPFRPR